MHRSLGILFKFSCCRAQVNKVVTAVPFGDEIPPSVQELHQTHQLPLLSTVVHSLPQARDNGVDTTWR